MPTPGGYFLLKNELIFACFFEVGMVLIDLRPSTGDFTPFELCEEILVVLRLNTGDFASFEPCEEIFVEAWVFLGLFESSMNMASNSFTGVFSALGISSKTETC